MSAMQNHPEQVQEEIEVWEGHRLVSILPKSSEEMVRKIYFGKPEERMLMIKKRNAKAVSKEELTKVVSKISK